MYVAVEKDSIFSNVGDQSSKRILVGKETIAMATFISLMNFTGQGVRDFQASPKRAEAFKKTAKVPD